MRYTVTAPVEIPVQLDEGKHPADLVRSVEDKLERVAAHVADDATEWARLDCGQITGTIQTSGIVVIDAEGFTTVATGSAFRLREALGPRGRIDPAKPVIL